MSLKTFKNTNKLDQIVIYCLAHKKSDESLINYQFIGTKCFQTVQPNLYKLLNVCSRWRRWLGGHFEDFPRAFLRFGSRLGVAPSIERARRDWSTDTISWAPLWSPLHRGIYGIVAQHTYLSNAIAPVIPDDYDLYKYRGWKLGISEYSESISFVESILYKFSCNHRIPTAVGSSV